MTPAMEDKKSLWFSYPASDEFELSTWLAIIMAYQLGQSASDNSLVPESELASTFLITRPPKLCPTRMMGRFLCDKYQHRSHRDQERNSHSCTAHSLLSSMAPIPNEASEQLRSAFAQVSMNRIVIPPRGVLKSQDTGIGDIFGQLITYPVVAGAIFAFICPRRLILRTQAVHQHDTARLSLSFRIWDG